MSRARKVIVDDDGVMFEPCDEVWQAIEDLGGLADLDVRDFARATKFPKRLMSPSDFADYAEGDSTEWDWLNPQLVGVDDAED